MKLHEAFNRLALGELSDLGIVEDGKVRESFADKVLYAINEAVVRLHTRFNLMEEEVLIEQVEHITHYHLDPRYSESLNGPEQFRYIKDISGVPFGGRVIRIMGVADHYGMPLPLNTATNPHSLWTPKPDVLLVPVPVTGQIMSVSYQSSPAPLKKGDDYGDVEVPYYLEGPMMTLAAHIIYAGRNGQENQMKADSLLMRYDVLCGEVKSQGVVESHPTDDNIKLKLQGFV